MSRGASQHGLSSTHVLRERCSALGMPTWRFSASGGLLAPPTEEGEAGRWLRSRFVAGVVSAQAAAWQEGAEIAPVSVFPGCWLIPLEEKHRRRRVALVVAMAMSREAFGSREFEDACASAALDVRTARQALRSVTVFDGASVGRQSMVLGWMHQDLSELGTGEANLEMLSRQLSESYEEMSLLYKLREYMSELVHPQRFVRQACFELHDVLPFRWVASGFADDEKRTRALAGGLFSSGDLPCSPEKFRRAAVELIERLRPGQCLTLDGGERGVLARGASQVLVYPIAHDGDVIGAFFVGDKKGTDTEVTNIELKMIEAAAGYVSILIENTGLYEDQHAMFLGTVRALTASIDAKDPYTCGHSERVANLAAQLARAHGLPETIVERVRIAGLVHDIGKIGVPEEVLRKPGRLTDEEFEMMKAHPAIGHHILQDIPQLDDVLPGVLHHHERFDGRGYPQKIAGESIPLMARIIALADSFDAMSSNRTYRAAMSRERVLTEIRQCAGSQFDPDLAEIFVRLDFREYDEAAARHRSERRLGEDGGASREAAA